MSVRLLLVIALTVALGIGVADAADPQARRTKARAPAPQTAQAATPAAKPMSLGEFDRELARLNAEAARNRDTLIDDGARPKRAEMVLAPKPASDSLEAEGVRESVTAPETDFTDRMHRISEIALPNSDCRFARLGARGDGVDYLREEDRYLRCPVFRFDIETPTPSRSGGP